MAIGEETLGETSFPATTTSGNVNSTTGATVFPSIDHNHPLFLQPKHTPGSILISLQLKGSDNYALWSKSMRIGLLGKSKLGFVDGRFPKSKIEPELHDQWEKVNDVVLSWIMNAVRPCLLSSVVYASNAHKFWEDLKERFNKDTMSIVDYFSKLRDLWDEFDALMLCH
ncbi:uncharacterized protein LOC107792785 [Nicotiana tabacum]|uniref:Uncharacterized protein LOC107792785 n=1 Tax=Nicotiana tabacum TaxID=4097 RepID=A0A1S4A1R3_TOBAC|nr:PREDICTED: uncharacterized protein LOC107792785 [Nicotiana tabacum]